MSRPITSIKPEIWFIDIEYVPCIETGRRVLSMDSEFSDESVLEAMYRAAGATADNPRPMLKSILYRIVSVSALIRKVNGDISLKLFSRPLDDNFCEREIIEAFLKGLGERLPQLVGFASSTFDLPTIFQRAIVNGVDATRFCQRPEKPWFPEPDYFSDKNDWNVDLMNIIGHYGKGTPKLAEVALACGIPAKIGATGADVADMWFAGKRREIVDYNECDVLSTYLVWLDTVRTCGLMDGVQVYEEHIKLMELLNAEAEAKPHLKEFRDRWIAFRGPIEITTETPAEQAITQPEPHATPAAEPASVNGQPTKLAPEVFVDRATSSNPNISRSLVSLVTGRQLGMIRAIARELGIDADEECASLMHCRADELHKRAASDFINHLQELQRQGVPA